MSHSLRPTDGSPSTLVAVLLNPPGTTSGGRSRAAVARAATLLGYDDVRVLNLCLLPTASVVELNDAQSDFGWAEARDQLHPALLAADGLLGAWGIAGVTGHKRRLRDQQVGWLKATAMEGGLSHVWMVGGAPRHPSRWHQFVADKYGRTTGGSFDERLAQVLVSVPLTLPEGPADAR